MAYFSAGVDHTTCPVALREPLNLGPEGSAGLLSDLVARRGLEEAVVVSTCARTEIYAWSESLTGESFRHAARGVFDGLSPGAGLLLVSREGEDVVRHAFRLMSGLESQVVGESEIAGQVRAAVNQARARDAIGAHLDVLFRSATSCSRRLRAETSLGQSDVSVATAAAEIVRNHARHEDVSILIIGSGRVARMLARELKPAKRLAITSRTEAASRHLAGSAGIEWLPFGQAIATLKDFDVLVCATRSTRPLFGAEQLAGSGRVLILDLAVPRNVESSAGELSGVSLFGVDQVKSASAPNGPDENLIDSIIEAEVHDFIGRQSIGRAAPLIQGLRDHVERVKSEELLRVGNQLERLSPSGRAVVETVAERMVDRMFHHLVIRLRLAALTDPELLRAAEFFFAHGEESVFPTDEIRVDNHAQPSEPVRSGA